MNTRCKAICSNVSAYLGTVWDEHGQNPTYGKLHKYEFYAVTSGSDENKRFYASTPSLNMTVSCVRDDAFELGKEYYLDFSLSN